MFKFDHDTVEATKTICCGKGEESFDHSQLTRWFNKFCLDCKNLDNQARLDRPRTKDSETVLQAIVADSASNTWRVSGELSISEFSLVHHLHELGKSIQSCPIVLQAMKMMQNF